MRIETKYNIGDKVKWVRRGCVRTGWITKIIVPMSGEVYYDVTYIFDTVVAEWEIVEVIN